MIRLGLIGFGQQGKLYAGILTGLQAPGMPAVTKPENCVLTAISARNKSVKTQIEKLPGVQYFLSWQEMLTSDACDAVIITVPHFLHSEIAIRALEAGKHVLCEKPITVRASDAETLLTVQELHPECALAMMLNQRTNSLLQKIKEIIKSGELGSFRGSNYIMNNCWRPDNYYAGDSWRGTWNGEGGGILVNQACHPLDIWLWLCGAPSSVYAKCVEGAHRDIDVENDVAVLAQYPNGALGTFTTCSHDPLGTDRLEISFEQGKILLEGSSKATIFRYAQPERKLGEAYDFRRFSYTLRTASETIYQKEELTFRQNFGEDYTEMFRNFAAHILEGEELIAPAREGLKQVQIANAIHLSGWTGQEVTFPCDSAEYNRYLEVRMQK